MDKTSLEYSKSIFGTYGNFYKTFGNYECLNMFDKLILEFQDKLDIKIIGIIHTHFNKVNFTFKQLNDIKDSATKKEIAVLVKHKFISYIDNLEILNDLDNRFRTIMKNFVTIKYRILISEK